MILRSSILLFLSLLALLACTKEPKEPELVSGIPVNVGNHLNEIPTSVQRNGDIEQGKDYLLNGDYIKSGVPYFTYGTTIGLTTNPMNVLERTGINEDIYFEYTALESSNGVDIVSPNCFQCHGGYVDDTFVLGLGNTAADFTLDQGAAGGFLDAIVSNTFGNPSPEWDAYFPFSRAVNATSSHLITETVGANPADKLAVVLAAHRDKDDLTWKDSPGLPIPNEVIPADVPAWWLLKKKSAMFSTGIGRGDFAKMMMASSILTLEDSTEARRIDDEFVNVKEFILSLEAPAYPLAIDEEMADRGKTLFEINCSTCHGTYGDNESYTTYVVDHEIVQTDSLLALSNYAYEEFENWFNTSWFGLDKHNAQIVPGGGYIAQPLDGVWATAPYLHNGSVPTLEDLLNSPQRPEFWSVSGSRDNYDHQKMGLKYEEETSKVNSRTYDTNLTGYGNRGHYFGDHLEVDQRADLIEYLKTL